MMKWYDKLQYGAMLLMAAAVPQGWHYGLWAATLLGGVTIIKMVAQHKVGNPALDKTLRWAMLGAVVYWLVLAVSLLWTRDLATGGTVLYLKAVLLIFPLCFLLSDTSYLTPCRLRGVGFALLVGVVGAFLYFLIRAGIAMHHGVSFMSFNSIFYNRENDIVYHHAYIALYAVIAMVFVYHLLSSHWKELKWWLRGLLVVALLMLISYTVMVNSRAGVLAMGLAAFACVIHLAFSHRSWLLGIGIALLVTGGIVAATKLMPGYVDRIFSTVENVEDDARTSINRANFHAVMQSPVIGYGVGDYHAVQVAKYGDEGFDYGVTAGFNAHNQYMESLLSAGIPGLLALLNFLLVPIFVALKRRSRYGFLSAVMIGVVMFNLLFESMFERQMGLQFIGYLYTIMVLIMSVEENKFAQSKKS